MPVHPSMFWDINNSFHLLPRTGLNILSKGILYSKYGSTLTRNSVLGCFEWFHGR